MKQLKNSLDKKPDILQEYNKTFHNYLNEGIIEKVPPNLEISKPGSVHYLPHQAIVKQNRQTTKLRIVFDAASKWKNEISLNEALLPGPCLLPILYDILIRFRVGKYGLVADIKQTFLQIYLHEDHRNFVRFLWFDDIYDKTSPVSIFRFTRVLFGLTSSPFLLNATLKVHLEKYLELPDYRDIIEKLLLNLYVDDSTNTFDNFDDAVEFYNKATAVLGDASFDLRKWATNNPDLRNIILKNDVSNESDENQRKVLGVIWDIKTDEFVFDFSEIINLCNTLTPTKRNILRIQGMFYDPLGLTSPLSLPVRIILQNLFKLKLAWDDYIDQETLYSWKQYIKGLQRIRSVSCSRRVFFCEGDQIQLHGFCDSSEKAYCATVYVRVACSHGIKVSLWSAKSRIAPPTGHSIPRLELLSCVLLARLMSHVKKAIEKELVVEDHNIFCWSDSMVSLWWIKSVHKRWKVWVENRVSVVRKLVGSER